MLNRTRLSSLDAFGLRDQRNRIYPALEASDGSTLSLDFTQMSSLDSRFTFSRSSTATVINSSGLVQYAAANLMTFSEDQGNNTTWSAFGTSVTRTTAQSDPLGGSSAIRLSFDATSSDAVISRTVSVNNGLPYVISMWMRSDSGTVTNVRFARSDAAAGAIFPTLTTTWQRVELSFTASSTSSGIEIRVLNSGSPKTATIHVFGAQLEPGSVMRSYQPATGGTTYHAPRFDYDPTTLAPRGLLIEGSATNLIVRSEDFSATSWTIRGNVTTTGNTSDVTDPAGGNTATKVVTASSGSLIYCSVAQPVAVTANTTYTMSFWIRGDAGNQCRAYAYQGGTPGDLISQTTYTYSSTGWTRVQTQFTTGAGHTGVYVYVCSQNVTAAKTFYIWGAQLEAGSGASSYIPTSASTVTRTVDKLSMTNISTMQWNQTAGTFLWNMDVQSETNTSSYPAFAGMYRAGPVRVIRFQLNNSSGVNPRVGGDTWTATPSVIATSPFYTRPVGTPFKAAVAFANTGQSMTYCINGSVQSAVTGTGTLATPTLLLMHQDPSAADTEYFPIHLRQLKYWPTNLSSSDLRSITL